MGRIYSPPLGGILTPSEYYARRASGLLGVTDFSTFQWTFDDFEEGSARWTRAVAGAEVIQCDSTRAGGWIELQTGGVAAAAPTLIQGDNSGGANPAFWSEDTAGVWYAALRIKFTTSVSTAQTSGGLIMRRPTGPTVGTLGKVAGEANFAFSADSGATLTSSVAVDTAVHVLEVYRVGGTTTFLVDGAVADSDDTFTTELSQPVLRVQNGTDALNRAFVVDWIAGGNSGRVAA